MSEIAPIQYLCHAYYLLEAYTYQLLNKEEYVPEIIWKNMMQDEDFNDIVAELTDNGYVVRGEHDNGPGYSITVFGQDYLCLFADLLKAIWLKNTNGKGEDLINAVADNLNAYADAMRKRQVESDNDATVIPTWLLPTCKDFQFINTSENNGTWDWLFSAN